MGLARTRTILTEWAALSRQAAHRNRNIHTLSIGRRLNLDRTAKSSARLVREHSEVLCANGVVDDDRSGLGLCGSGGGYSQHREDGLSAHVGQRL